MSIKVVDAVFATLTADTEFMAFLGLTPSSLMADKIIRVVREEEPDQALTPADIPKIFIITKPGRFGRNHLVYEGKFCLDFLAKNSYSAKQMSERAFKLFHNRKITDEGFYSYLCTLAHDSGFATGITGVKGYEAIYDVDYLRTN